MSPPIVNIQDLRKRFGEQTVVDGLSLSVPEGQCCGILGPNGAGKTTTLRMLLGNLPPCAGTLEVLGHAIPKQARQMRRWLGVVPQQDNLDPDFTTAQNLDIYGRYFGLSRAERARRIPELIAFAALESKRDARVFSLSGGMQRRLTLARALINQPRLLILDEPTTGLDPQARHLMWQRLRGLRGDGLTIILTTHYMEEAERLCDRIVLFEQGKILCDGAPKALIQTHIESHVVEVHGEQAAAWHQARGKDLGLRCEDIGDARLYYTDQPQLLLAELERQGNLWFTQRPANLEDVFLKLTGRELRDG